MLQVLPPGFTINIDIDRLLDSPEMVLMCAGLYRYGHIQPSEVDRMSVRRANGILKALKYLVSEEEKARIGSQQELIAQMSLKKNF